MKRINWIILFSVAITMSACNNETEEVKKTTQLVNVLTDISKEINYSPSLEFSGTALPYKEANLGTPLPGRVEKIYFQNGDYVKKDALIARLSQNLLEQSNAELDAVKKDYERVKRLQKKGSLTQQDLDHISAKLKATKAKSTMLSSFSEIRAPFSGKVVGFLLNEGEVYTIAFGLKPGYSMTSGIVRLMQLDTVKVCIEVNEKDYPQIKEGMLANIKLDAYPDTVFCGSVKHKSDFLSTMTRTAEVEIIINNEDELIKPGMFARVDLKMKEKSAVFVPQEAIFKLEGTGEEYLFLLENEIVNRFPVTRLGYKDNMVSVEGLSAGLEVLISSQRKLNDGDQIKVIK